MKEKLKKIGDWIVENYEELPKSDIDGKELVIFATGDFSGEYGYGSSDLQSWGFDKEGKLFWAYASGCSCNCYAGVDDADEKTWKLFEATPLSEDSTDLLKQIALFELDIKAFKDGIGSYSYQSY